MSAEGLRWPVPFGVRLACDPKEAVSGVLPNVVRVMVENQNISVPWRQVALRTQSPRVETAFNKVLCTASL